MDFINILIFVVLVIDFIIVFVTLIDSKNKDTITNWYVINIITVALWVLGMILYRASNQDTIVFFTKFIYIAASLIVSSFYYFSLLFQKLNRKYPIHIIFVSIFNIVILFLTIFTDTIIISAKKMPVGENEFYVGTLYWLFVIYTIYFLSSSFIRLFIRSFYSKDKIEKAQFLYLAIGYTIPGIISMTTNLLLPWYGVYNYNWVGPLSTLCMVISITYAVTKYKLFNIKIITTELLIFLLWIFTAIKTFVSHEIDGIFVNISFFILSIFVGLLLIRSVKNEVEQKERNERLAHNLSLANIKLKEVDELKSELVSLATHHISTPLTAVKGYASLIQEGHYGEVPERMEEVLKIIETSTDRMSNTVRDFLDISSLDNNEIVYNFKVYSIKDLLDELVLKYNTLAKNKGLNFIYETKEGDYNIKADIKKLTQAFNNILENCFRYTKNGFIKIELFQNQSQIFVLISDNGVRNTPVMSKKLSEKFTKSGNETEANIIGAGLGLYVSKNIIEEHKGNFEIKSNANGTEFYIKLSYIP